MKKQNQFLKFNFSTHCNSVVKSITAVLFLSVLSNIGFSFASAAAISNQIIAPSVDWFLENNVDDLIEETNKAWKGNDLGFFKNLLNLNFLPHGLSWEFPYERTTKIHRLRDIKTFMNKFDMPGEMKVNFGDSTRGSSVRLEFRGNDGEGSYVELYFSRVFRTPRIGKMTHVAKGKIFQGQDSEWYKDYETEKVVREFHTDDAG